MTGSVARLGGWFSIGATIFAASVATSLALSSPTRAADPELSLVSIATGSRSGVYYFAGGVICAGINAHRWQHGIRCLAEKTGGSIDNLRAIRSGSATFAIVQADWHHGAVNGTGIFEALGADRTLRSVFSIYPESFTVVAGRESGIDGLADLPGKRVNIGPPGSGGRATMDVVMQAMEWEEGDFAALTGTGMAEVSDALCNGDIDAAVFTIAHPNLAVENLLTTCGARMIAVEGPGISRLVAEHPFYFASLIAGNTYPAQRDPVPVFSLTATLVTSTRTQPSAVYELVKAVFDDLPGFRAAHPSFSELSVEQMLSEGLSAPMHSGALRYFEQAGLR